MIYLRKAKEIDIEKLHISLNKKYVEKNKKNVIKLENRYKEWYKNLIESDKFILLIIENENNDFIGHIKYEMKSEEVEVLIFILEKYRNNGIGKKALEESFMYIDKNKKIVAKILEENIDSLKLFEKNGFVYEKSGRPAGQSPVPVSYSVCFGSHSHSRISSCPSDHMAKPLTPQR